MQLTNTQNNFLTFVRAGLWEKEARILQFEHIDFAAIMQLAEAQSVVGLVAAGLEHVKGGKVPQEWVLQFIGATLQIEQRNKAMNEFVAHLIERLRKEQVYVILVKGQGIAQCYERPLWRSCGDVDLLLNKDDYRKAKAFLIPIATRVDSENIYTKHLALVIQNWEVELHGNLRGGLRRKMDKGLDGIMKSAFRDGRVRSWLYGKTQIFQLSVEDDIIFVFSHILQHFYKEGIGLRQICDWCRILWTYQKTIDEISLQSRLNNMGIASEWKAFANFAVNYLDMPAEAMPLYDNSLKWDRKARRIFRFVLETGNFGHNKDLVKNHFRYSPLRRKLLTFKYGCLFVLRHFLTFPLQTIQTLKGVVAYGFRNTFFIGDGWTK